MNLPFGNASAIKYCKKDVQPSWARLAQETGPGPPASEGTRGGAGGCLALGGPGEAAEPFPRPPPTPSPGSSSFKRAHWGPSLPSPVLGRSRAGSLLMHQDGY